MRFIEESLGIIEKNKTPGEDEKSVAMRLKSLLTMYKDLRDTYAVTNFEEPFKRMEEQTVGYQPEDTSDPSETIKAIKSMLEYFSKKIHKKSYPDSEDLSKLIGLPQNFDQMF